MAGPSVKKNLNLVLKVQGLHSDSAWNMWGSVKASSILIIISPLKRLQAVQVLEFERYGINTVAINEDTPNDPELWKVWPQVDFPNSL